MALILCDIPCRNHSWVSFQGFCESYNDAFNLPQELGEHSIHFFTLATPFSMIYTELIPRIVGDAFYWGELEAELRLIGRSDYCFKKDSDREVCMDMIESIRRTGTYPHPESECTADCKKRGS